MIIFRGKFRGAYRFEAILFHLHAADSGMLLAVPVVVVAAGSAAVGDRLLDVAAGIAHDQARWYGSPSFDSIRWIYEC
jgi:hypothetical protein